MLKNVWHGSGNYSEKVWHNRGLAPLRDRVAAQVLDLMIGIFVIRLLLIFITPRYAGIVFSAGRLSISADPFITDCEVVVVSVFLYYLLMESIWSATVGKLLCRMAVRREGETGCGVAAALIRTITRPLDWIIGMPVIGASRKNQRIGDMISCTVVTVPITPARSAFAATSAEHLCTTPAGWEARTKAALIDSVLLALSICAILYGLSALRLRPTVNVELGSETIMILCEWLFFYFVLSEALTGGTMGKLFLALRVVRTDGSPCGFAEATTRAVWRVIDLSTLGLLPFLVLRYGKSGRHLGELLADTLVEESKPSNVAVLWTTVVFGSVSMIIATYPFWRRIL